MACPKRRAMTGNIVSGVVFLRIDIVKPASKRTLDIGVRREQLTSVGRFDQAFDIANGKQGPILAVTGVFV